VRVPFASGIIEPDPAGQTIGGWLGSEVEGFSFSSNGIVKVDDSPKPGYVAIYPIVCRRQPED